LPLASINTSRRRRNDSRSSSQLPAPQKLVDDIDLDGSGLDAGNLDDGDLDDLLRLYRQ